MPTASLPAPEPPFAAERCGNCGRLVDRLFHERCRTCYEYRRKHKRERPAHLWNGKRPAVVWEPAEMTDRCECGKAAVWRVTVPVSECSRTTLLLCEACAEVERSFGFG